MIHLPNEIVNKIISYLERPKHVKIMKYLIEDCYEEDYNPYTAEYCSDNYCYEYSFQEWYYLYRYHFKLGGKKRKFYKKEFKYTPEILLIGSERLKS
jgi:hypothetical protein